MAASNGEHGQVGRGRPAPASGGQNRLGWGCSTLLALLVLATLLVACRDSAVSGPPVSPAAALTRLAGISSTGPTTRATSGPAATLRATSTPTAQPPPTHRSTAPRTVTAAAASSQSVTPRPSATATISATQPPTRSLETARVIKIVDGDTVRVVLSGQEYAVRYIGIDTPEIVHPGLPTEPFGPEAAEANRQLVLNRDVLLERDISDTDRYGRLLRYVWVGDLMVNGELVRLGLAQSNHYEPDVLYQDRLDALENEARAAGLGIWGVTPKPPSPPDARRSQALGVFIAEVFKAGKPETVALENNGLVPVDLSGWTLVSVRGNQRYGIPGGTVLDPGASITIYSGPGADTAGPLYWTTDNMWNNSEFDPAELYDAAGGLVNSWEG